MDVHSWILRRGESFLQIARYLFSNLHVLVIGESQIGPFRLLELNGRKLYNSGSLASYPYGIYPSSQISLM